MKKLSKLVLGPEKSKFQLPPEHTKMLLGGYDGDDDDCECLSFGACGTQGCRCCCKPGCKKRCPYGGK